MAIDEGLRVIDDLASLKAFADPFRHRIMALLDRPRTVKELAARLERPADRLYYHLRLLEQHGLVRASTDGRGGKRRYEQGARSFTVDASLVTPGALDGFIGEVFDQARAEWIRASHRPRDPEVKRSMLSMLHLRLTEPQRIELMQALVALADKFQDNGDCDDDDGRVTFGLLTGMWPVERGEERTT